MAGVDRNAISEVGIIVIEFGKLGMECRRILRKLLTVLTTRDDDVPPTPGLLN